MDVLALQRLGLRRADAKYLGHSEQRRRLGSGHRAQPAAKLRVGQIGACADDELFHHHQPAGTDGAGKALGLGADAFVVDADRSGDGVFCGQQDRRVGGDLVDQRDVVGACDLVHLRLAAVEHALDALLNVRRHAGGVGEAALQFGAAGVEGADRTLGVAARWHGDHRAVERIHVANDRGHHFGAIGGALQITRLNRVGVDAQPAEGASQNQRHQNDRKHLPPDGPILQRPSGGSFRPPLRLRIVVGDQSVHQVLLGERGHCCTTALPPASRCFPI